MLFRLNGLLLVLVLLVPLVASAAAGERIGRRRPFDEDREHTVIGMAQNALLGFVALLLAFGLTMAVGRYEARRDALLAEANSIGTAHLRARTIAEPQRAESLDLLRRYIDVRIALSAEAPGSEPFRRLVATSSTVEADLWLRAAASLETAPTANASRLFVESLNELFDDDTTRVAELADHVPTTVVYLQIAASTLAVGVMSAHFAALGRRRLPAAITVLAFATVLLVMLDLDRPQRGLITIDAAPLEAARQMMDVAPR